MRRAAFVVAAGAIGAIGACSLTTDLSGFAERAEPAPPDGGAADTSTTDAFVADVVNDVPSPACKPSVVLDTPLTTTLDTWSPRSNTDGYPKIETFFGASAAVILPFVDTTPIPIDAGDPDAGPTFYNPPERAGAITGIWQITALPLRSFDVEVEVQVRCTRAGSCADGVALAWLATKDATLLPSSNIGGAQGIPGTVDGMGVFLDNYQNDANESADPAVPSLQIVKLDETKVPGKYPWVVASKSAAFLGAWHKLGVSVRGDGVSVRFDGQAALATKGVTIASGLIGLTSGTGGQTDAVAVRNFKGSFYDCTP